MLKGRSLLTAQEKGMEINHEETKGAKVFFRSFFAPFVSSWLISARAGNLSRNFVNCASPQFKFIHKVDYGKR